MAVQGWGLRWPVRAVSGAGDSRASLSSVGSHPGVTLRRVRRKASVCFIPQAGRQVTGGLTSQVKVDCEPGFQMCWRQTYHQDLGLPKGQPAPWPGCPPALGC